MKQLTEKQFNELLNELEGKGFRPNTKVWGFRRMSNLVGQRCMIFSGDYENDDDLNAQKFSEIATEKYGLDLNVYGCINNNSLCLLNEKTDGEMISEKEKQNYSITGTFPTMDGILSLVRYDFCLLPDNDKSMKRMISIIMDIAKKDDRIYNVAEAIATLSKHRLNLVDMNEKRGVLFYVYDELARFVSGTVGSGNKLTPLLEKGLFDLDNYVRKASPYMVDAMNVSIYNTKNSCYEYYKIGTEEIKIIKE